MSSDKSKCAASIRSIIIFFPEEKTITCFSEWSCIHFFVLNLNEPCAVKAPLVYSRYFLSFLNSSTMFLPVEAGVSWTPHPPSVLNHCHLPSNVLAPISSFSQEALKNKIKINNNTLCMVCYDKRCTGMSLSGIKWLHKGVINFAYKRLMYKTSLL